jgi:hypothetical protein
MNDILENIEEGTFFKFGNEIFKFLEFCGNEIVVQDFMGEIDTKPVEILYNSNII